MPDELIQPDELIWKERHGAVLELRLNNPPYNGLSGPLLSVYLRSLEEARLDDAVRAVVTTATGPTWCAGGDLTQLNEEAPDRSLSDMLHESTGESATLSLVDRQADQLGAGRHVLTIDGFDKPMIAAINGAAAGGGFALALLHDIRFASERAIFTVAFTRIGLSLEMGLELPAPPGCRAAGGVRPGRDQPPGPGRGGGDTRDRVESRAGGGPGFDGHRVRPGPGRALAACVADQQAPAPANLGQHLRPQQLETEWPWQVAAYASPEARAAIEAFFGRTPDGPAG